MIVLLLTASLVYSGGPAFKVRNSEFGMSLKQVVNIEKEKLLEKGDDYLFYSTTMNNYDYRLLYNFVDNKLYRIIYSLNENFVNMNNYITSYKDMKDKLTEKYGKPTGEEENWNNDLYKDDAENYGLAVSIGHLSYTTYWVTNNIEIHMLLSGEEYKVTSLIYYIDTNLAKIADDKKNNEEQKNY